MACHVMDLPFWALDLRHPTTIEAQGPPVDPETTPTGLEVKYEFPASGDRAADRPDLVRRRQASPRSSPSTSSPSWGLGVLFVGDKGMLQADYGRRLLFPEAEFKDFKPPEPTIPASIGHHAEWIAACKDGRPTTCNFDYSGALTEAVLLGQRRLSDRQEDRVGRPEPQGDQLPRGRGVPPPRLPQGLDALIIERLEPPITIHQR